MSKKYKHRKTFTFDGQRYEVAADTLENLYAKKANKLRDLEEGKVRVTSAMTVAAWIDTCIDTYKIGASAKYRSQMKQRLHKHVSGAIGSRQLRSIKPIDLQNILNAQAGKSESHVKKLYQEMCFVFEKAQQNHLLIHNLAENLVRPHGYIHKRRSLTDAERRHFLAVCDRDPRFVLFLLMLKCGCRSKEARDAIGKDIILEDGVPVLHIRGTKSANADRFVPIPLDLYARIKNTPKFANIAQSDAGTYINETTYKRMTERLRREMNLSMGCKTYRNKLIPPYPLAPDFVPYMLRHTYCTDLQKRGVDIRTAQYLMGHSDISITANIYTHVDMGQVVAAAALINDRGSHAGSHT